VTRARIPGHDAVVKNVEHRHPLPAAALITAGNALLADAATVEAITALHEAGITPIVLRGPVVAHHFYADRELRSYADADLLVEASRRATAEDVLRNLGYDHSAVLGQRAADRPPWSSTWIRNRDCATVDLHWTLVGARAGDVELWRVLRGAVEPIELLNRSIDGLNVEATALIVALHAAHHGSEFRRPLEDLQRALDGLQLQTWKRVCALAARIDASEAFAAGLRLLPDGEQLAEELALPAVYSVETLLRSESAPPMSLGFDWLARTPGNRRKLALVLGKLVPDKEFMRAWSPLAGRGTKGGLALAYAWRPLWLIWHSVPGFRAWLAAQKRSNPGRGRDCR
jgi:hypothetical protein